MKEFNICDYLCKKIITTKGKVHKCRIKQKLKPLHVISPPSLNKIIQLIVQCNFNFEKCLVYTCIKEYIMYYLAFFGALVKLRHSQTQNFATCQHALAMCQSP